MRTRRTALYKYVADLNYYVLIVDEVSAKCQHMDILSLSAAKILSVLFHNRLYVKVDLINNEITVGDNNVMKHKCYVKQILKYILQK